MDLASGGHLSHGAAPNLSGKWFDVQHYGVRRQDGLIDYDEVERLAAAHAPKLIIAGGSAYPRTIDFERFRAIADDCGGALLVDMAHFAGLVAGGVHASPIPHADVVTTTTYKSLRGARGGLMLTNDEALALKLDSAMFPGLQGSPLLHAVAAKAVCLGVTPAPWASGDTQRDQGISRDGPAWIRAQLIQMAWRWLRYQPDSALSKWFNERTAGSRGRIRRVMIVALARKLLIALWRFSETGLVPTGAKLA